MMSHVTSLICHECSLVFLRMRVRMTLGPLLLFLFVGGAISIERVFVTEEEQENILENVIRYDNLKKE